MVAAASLLFVGPLLFMVASSFKPDLQIFADLRSFRAFLPVGDVSLDNYRGVFEKSRLPRYFLNSVLIAGVTVSLGIVANSMAAYGLQRCRWRGQRLALALTLALLVIPFEVVAIPLMMMVSGLPWPGFEDGALILRQSWFSSLHVQIIPFIANAFCIFLFYQSFRDIPLALDEAADAGRRRQAPHLRRHRHAQCQARHRHLRDHPVPGDVEPIPVACSGRARTAKLAGHAGHTAVFRAQQRVGRDHGLRHLGHLARARGLRAVPASFRAVRRALRAEGLRRRAGAA